MKEYFITFLALFSLLTTQSFSEERKKGVMEKFKNATCEGFFFGIKAGKNCDKINNSVSNTDEDMQKKSKKVAKKSKFKKKVCEGFFFGIKAGKDCERYIEDATKTAKKNADIITNENLKKTYSYSSTSNTNIS